MTQTKRVIRGLTDAVKGGVLPIQTARATVVLMRAGGYLSAPEAQAAVKSFRVGVKNVSDPKVKAKTTPAAGTKAANLFNGARVKDVGDRLSKKRYEEKAANGGPVMWAGKTLERPSEYDHGVIGAFTKFALRRLGVACELTGFEKSLLAEYAERGQWVGTTPDGMYFGGGPDGCAPAARVKALLDDTVSGGLYLNPVVLDEAIVTKPLLSGQLFPLVDVKPVTGRRVITPVMENLTVAWGNASGTAVQPFNTASLVSPLDTAVYPVSGFCEVGNDLLSDSPVGIGTEVVARYGEVLKKELDRVIAVGNGYNEPLGILNSSGLTAVVSDSGAGGPPTVGDAEALIFGVPLQYRQQDLNPAFVMNDTTYRRFRGLPVGPGDERRVFGMGMMGTDDTQRYQLFEYKARIQNDLPNSKAAFGCLKKYRLFQRLGMELVRESGGRQLTLANTSLVGIRARFGGRVVDGSAFALVSDLQS